MHVYSIKVNLNITLISVLYIFKRHEYFVEIYNELLKKQRKDET